MFSHFCSTVTCFWLDQKLLSVILEISGEFVIIQQDKAPAPALRAYETIGLLEWETFTLILLSDMWPKTIRRKAYFAFWAFAAWKIKQINWVPTGMQWEMWKRHFHMGAAFPTVSTQIHHRILYRLHLFNLFYYLIDWLVDWIFRTTDCHHICKFNAWILT